MYGAWGRGAALPSALLYAALVAFGYLNIAAVTQINLATQVAGLLAKVNGGAGADMSSVTFPSSGTIMTTATNVACSQLPALTGDTTSSAGSCANVNAKINGTSVPTNSAADQVILTTASATGSWGAVPSCSSGSQALTYNTTTHAFGCVAIMGGTFADNETPTGSCPTTTLTLGHTPSPAASLALYYNGQLLVAGGADYTLATATVTLTNSCPTGTVFRATYRY